MEATIPPRATCDATGQCLELGPGWYHLQPAQDLCAAAFQRLEGDQQAGWVVVDHPAALGDMLERYSVDAIVDAIVPTKPVARRPPHFQSIDDVPQLFAPQHDAAKLAVRHDVSKLSRAVTNASNMLNTVEAAPLMDPPCWCESGAMEAAYASLLGLGPSQGKVCIAKDREMHVTKYTNTEPGCKEELARMRSDEGIIADLARPGPFLSWIVVLNVLDEHYRACNHDEIIRFAGKIVEISTRHAFAAIALLRHSHKSVGTKAKGRKEKKANAPPVLSPDDYGLFNNAGAVADRLPRPHKRWKADSKPTIKRAREALSQHLYFRCMALLALGRAKYQIVPAKTAAAERFLIQGIEFVSRPAVACAVRELSWYAGKTPNKAEKILHDFKETLAIVRDRSEKSADPQLEVYMNGALVDPETTMKSAGVCAGARIRYDPDLSRISIGCDL